jgi:hypothetical protein
MADATRPAPDAPNMADVLDFVRGAKHWLDEAETAELAGFDPQASAVQLLDRAEELLEAMVAG